MIRTRELFRKSRDQESLDKNGYVVVDFLQNKNYHWLNSLYQKHALSGNSSQQQEDLDDKLQSKIEYRLINCSPIFYEFFSSNESSESIELNAPITMENKQASIVLLIPFFSSEKESCSISLFNNIGINAFPRVRTKIEFPKDNDLPTTVTLEYGQALFSFNHSPYYIHKNELNYFLKAHILPYESRPFLFIKSNNSILPFQSSSEKFVRYLLGEKNLTDKMIKKMPLESNDAISFEDISVVTPNKMPLLFRKLKNLLW